MEHCAQAQTMTEYWRTKTVIAVVAIIGLLLLLEQIPAGNSSQGRYYDCSMAEWHPDFPVKVKEACRARRK